MKRISIIIATIAVVTVGIVSYATFASHEPTEAPTQATEQALKSPTPQELLDAVNAERAKIGVAPLTIDERLNQSAQYKADDMVARGYRSHYDPTNPQQMNGVQRGYDLTRKDDGKSECSEISENLAWDNNKLKLSLNSSIRWWKSSEAHYNAMKNPEYKTTGFGINGYIITEHFCKP